MVARLELAAAPEAGRGGRGARQGAPGGEQESHRRVDRQAMKIIRRRSLRGWAAAVIGVMGVVIASSCSRNSPPDVGQQVHDLCAACHVYPPPDSFPRSAWPKEVLQGYDFARELRPDLPRPPIEEAVGYYQSRAPLELPLPAIANAAGPLPVNFSAPGDGAG